MIDPYNITNYNRTQYELEEFILFCVAVAGKTAKVIARQLDLFLSPANTTPFQYIQYLSHSGQLESQLRQAKLGQYTKLVTAYTELSRWSFDQLKNCMPNDLESIKGIGPKTSRFFILHSQSNAQYVVLDRHVLKYLKEQLCWENVPSNTPTSSQYAYWEEKLLKHLRQNNIPLAEFDLETWKQYAVK